MLSPDTEVQEKIVLPHNYVPRAYQLPFWQYMESKVMLPDDGEHKLGARAILVWHRRAGKDLTCLSYMATEALEGRVGSYYHLFPTYKQARRVIWQGKRKDGTPFLNAFPPEFVKKRKDDDMILELHNGSTYHLLGTDRDVDALVGSNPVGVILSEYSLQNPKAWNLIRPILAENEGWAIFDFTPRGRNHGYHLFEQAKKNPHWYCSILTVDDTKAIPVSVIDDDRASGMPEELVQQEYWCSFDAALQGAYYAKWMARAREDGRITKVPYEPDLDVHTAWDLGIDDQTVIWFFQIGPVGEVRLIDYYAASGEGLGHYVTELRERANLNNYVYGTHYFPHDVKVRELTTGKSRKEALEKMGLRVHTVPKLRVEDGIEAVRSILPKCYFDEAKCEEGLEALIQYRKEWNDETKTFSKVPVHDWTSHPSDAFRVLAVGVNNAKKPKDYNNGKPEYANIEYDMFDY